MYHLCNSVANEITKVVLSSIGTTLQKKCCQDHVDYAVTFLCYTSLQSNSAFAALHMKVPAKYIHFMIPY